MSKFHECPMKAEKRFYHDCIYDEPQKYIAMNSTNQKHAKSKFPLKEIVAFQSIVCV